MKPTMLSPHFMVCEFLFSGQLYWSSTTDPNGVSRPGQPIALLFNPPTFRSQYIPTSHGSAKLGTCIDIFLICVLNLSVTPKLPPRMFGVGCFWLETHPSCTRKSGSRLNRRLTDFQRDEAKKFLKKKSIIILMKISQSFVYQRWVEFF